MSLGAKALGAHVRHPDPQRPQVPLPHPPSVLADPFPHGHGFKLHNEQTGQLGSQTGRDHKQNIQLRPISTVRLNCLKVILRRDQ